MTIDYFEGDSRTNRERMLAGDLYIADDPENERLHRRGIRLADAYHRADVAGDAGARDLLADLLGTLGEGAHINPPLFVDYGENIHVGASPPTRSSPDRAATSSKPPSRSPSRTTSGSVAE